MNQAWTTLIAPILVALLVGYILKDIQQPDKPSLSAEISWIDTPNPFVSFDIKKAFEQDAKTETRTKVLDSLVGVAENFMIVRVATIRISNNSDVTLKNTEISLNDGGALYSYNEEKRALLETRAVVEALAPGASKNYTAILRPKIIGNDAGILITHDGMRVEPTPQQLNEEFHWLIPYLNRYPGSMIALAMISLGALLILAFGLLAVACAPDDLEWRAKNTTKKDALKMLETVEYIRKVYPNKLET